MTDEEIGDMIREADKDDDGQIDYKEFAKVIPLGCPARLVRLTDPRSADDEGRVVVSENSLYYYARLLLPSQGNLQFVHPPEAMYDI